MAIASRNTERLEQVATEILEGTDGGEVFPVGGSTCATPTQAGAMISHAKEAFGGVDILVNAAAGIPAGRFAEIEEVAGSYLVSDYADYVTDATLTIEGGQSFNKSFLRFVEDPPFRQS